MVKHLAERIPINEPVEINNDVNINGRLRILTGLRITENAGNGKVLTSDNEGNATWQTPSLGDNLGNHIATQDLNMSGYGINNVSSLNNTAINLKISNEDVVKITSEKNIGIGIPTPKRKLDIVDELSVGNLLIKQTEEGPVIGRTMVKPTHFDLSNVGVNWIPRMTDANRDWYGISMSADGKYQTAVVNGGYIYISSDYGQTWIPKMTDENRLWTGISMSADGKYQTAVVRSNIFYGYIYISSDYGQTWIPRMTDKNRDWYGISMSADGKYQTAVVIGDYIYTSSDYGQTWTERRTEENRNWVCISMSADGKYQTAIVNDGYIYISSNYGQTWVPRMTDTNRYWTGISMSADGKYQTAVVNGNYIYISSDYGQTWIPKMTDVNRDWYGIAMSANGKYQTAVVISSSSYGYIYTSYDYGQTWIPRMTDENRYWRGITMSADGKYQTAIVLNGYIYTSYADSVIPVGKLKIPELQIPTNADSDKVLTSDSQGNANWTSITTSHLNTLKPRPQSTPNNTIKVEGGTYIISTGLAAKTVSAQNSPTFSPVTVSGQKRIDLVVIDDNGSLSIVQGVQATNPIPPSYPSDKQVIAEVTIDETSNVTITESDIRDVRMFLNLGGGGVVEYRESYIVGTPSGNYTGSTTVFNLLNNYIRNGKNLSVYYNGVLMREGASNDYVETNENTVTFNTPRQQGSVVTFEWKVGAAPTTTLNEYRKNFIATTNQTVFSIAPDTYNMGGKNLQVYVDGVLLTLTEDYTETDASTITLVNPCSGGENVSLIWRQAMAAGNSDYVDGFNASSTPTANTLLALDGNAKFPVSVLKNLAHTNILINGGFEIWQRGTTFTASGWGTIYTADRWQVIMNNDGSTATITRCGIGESDTTQKDGLYAVKCVVTTSSGFDLLQRVENFRDYAGKTISLSAWCKTNVANKARLRIADGISNSDSNYHTGSGNWERLVVTHTVSNNNTQLFVYLSALQSGTYYWDNVMLVLGQESIDLIPRSFGEEMLLCQRYYETIDGARVFRGYGSSGTAFTTHISFNVFKARVPTMTLSSSNKVNCGDAYTDGVSRQGFALSVQPVSTGSFGLTLSWIADAEMY